MPDILYYTLLDSTNIARLTSKGKRFEAIDPAFIQLVESENPNRENYIIFDATTDTITDYLIVLHLPDDGACVPLLKSVERNGNIPLTTIIDSKRVFIPKTRATHRDQSLEDALESEYRDPSEPSLQKTWRAAREWVRAMRGRQVAEPDFEALVEDALTDQEKKFYSIGNVNLLRREKRKASILEQLGNYMFGICNDFTKRTLEGKNILLAAGAGVMQGITFTEAIGYFGGGRLKEVYSLITGPAKAIALSIFLPLASRMAEKALEHTHHTLGGLRSLSKRALSVYSLAAVPLLYASYELMNLANNMENGNALGWAISALFGLFLTADLYAYSRASQVNYAIRRHTTTRSHHLSRRLGKRTFQDHMTANLVYVAAFTAAYSIGVLCSRLSVPIERAVVIGSGIAYALSESYFLLNRPKYKVEVQADQQSERILPRYHDEGKVDYYDIGDIRIRPLKESCFQYYYDEKRQRYILIADGAFQIDGAQTFERTAFSLLGKLPLHRKVEWKSNKLTVLQYNGKEDVDVKQGIFN